MLMPPLRGSLAPCVREIDAMERTIRPEGRDASSAQDFSPRSAVACAVPERRSPTAAQQAPKKKARGQRSRCDASGQGRSQPPSRTTPSRRRRPRRRRQPRTPTPSSASPRPPAEEQQHIARYDAAIAQVARPSAEHGGCRTHPRCGAGHSRDRAGRRARRLRDQHQRPGRPQAGRLVPLPRRLWHRRRDPRVHGGQPGLARPRAPHTARRGGTVQEHGQPARGQGVLRRHAAGHRRRAGHAGRRAGCRQRPGHGQGARRQGVGRVRHPGRRRRRRSSRRSARF